jgi:hypothetical protein
VHHSRDCISRASGFVHTAEFRWRARSERTSTTSCWPALLLTCNGSCCTIKTYPSPVLCRSRFWSSRL